MESRQNQQNSSLTKYGLAGLDSLAIAMKAAQEKKIGDSRDFFEQLLIDFPTCGRFWKIYIEQELKARNFERVEKLFQRSLIKVLNIDLWKCYLNYVRDTKVKMPNYKEKTAQAYDFALDKIGLDVMSYSIWVDYVNFLKSVEASGSFAENQKITAIRKVYQKGVMNPMLNIEQLWKDYCIFENLINPLIAKRMIDDRSKDFMTVRKIAKEYENVTRNLDRSSPSFQPQGTQEEIKQKQFWKKYIQWEKSNPLKSEDNSLIAKRVLFALEQSLLAMSTHVDVSLEAVIYLQQQSAIMAEKCEIVMSKFYAEEVLQMYERLIKGPMANNMLVYFAYSDYEESRLNYQKVSQIYDKLLEIKEIDPSLCYIQYMRFLRRADGIRSARGVFKRAREDTRITYHVFVAAGLIEYFCTKDKNIASKIFQLGFKTFGHITEYLLAYIEFLTHLNDDEAMRTLFENSLNNNKLLNEKSGEIWSAWFEFENNVGNCKDLKNVEEKRKEKFLNNDVITERQTLLLVDKYKFMNTHPVTSLQLKFLGYKDSNSSAHLGLNQSVLNTGQESVLNTNLNENEQNMLNEDSNISNLLVQQTTSVYPDTDSSNPFSKLASRNLNKLPQPDIGKMLPFKSNKNAFSGLLPIPGGGMFLFPSVVGDMLRRLPPPPNFNGPFLLIDEFLEQFKTLNIPDDYESFTIMYENSLKNVPVEEDMKTEISSQDISAEPKHAKSQNSESPVKMETNGSNGDQASTLKRPFIDQQNGNFENESKIIKQN